MLRLVYSRVFVDWRLAELCFPFNPCTHHLTALSKSRDVGGNVCANLGGKHSISRTASSKPLGSNHSRSCNHSAISAGRIEPRGASAEIFSGELQQQPAQHQPPRRRGCRPRQSRRLAQALALEHVTAFAGSTVAAPPAVAGIPEPAPQPRQLQLREWLQPRPLLSKLKSAGLRCGRKLLHRASIAATRPRVEFVLLSAACAGALSAGFYALCVHPD